MSDDKRIKELCNSLEELKQWMESEIQLLKMNKERTLDKTTMIEKIQHIFSEHHVLTGEFMEADEELQRITKEYLSL